MGGARAAVAAAMAATGGAAARAVAGPGRAGQRVSKHARHAPRWVRPQRSCALAWPLHPQASLLVCRVADERDNLFYTSSLLDCFSLCKQVGCKLGAARRRLWRAPPLPLPLLLSCWPGPAVLLACWPACGLRPA